MTIVYTSKTGFTREYAQMLGRAAGLPVCALDEATGKAGARERHPCTWDG